ncbi:MAG: hypothetical protein IK999_06030 [Ruminococcus sp.]|nr:hypothetical protein [Ruminococcus sp.]
MNKDLCNSLLKICIDHYQKVYNDGMMHDNHDYYGTPPKSIIISFGSSLNICDWRPLAAKDKEAVFKYSSQGLQTVSLDTAPDYTENGMYYQEAYAELCYQENGIAFIMIQYGKRYASCYRYNIVNHDNNVQIINEELIWIS